MTINITQSPQDCGSVSAVYKIGISTAFTGKQKPETVSGAGFWDNVEFTVEQLSDHHGKGHPWMPAQLNNGGERWQSNANYAEVAALDLDNSEHVKDADGKVVKDANGKAVSCYKEELTIAQSLAHPYIKEHCALVRANAYVS